MRRIVAIAATIFIVMLFLVPVALAADAMPHSGRVLISTQGDVTIPANEQADLVMVVNGTATIAGDVNSIVVVNDGNVRVHTSAAFLLSAAGSSSVRYLPEFLRN